MKILKKEELQQDFKEVDHGLPFNWIFANQLSLQNYLESLTPDEKKKALLEKIFVTAYIDQDIIINNDSKNSKFSIHTLENGIKERVYKTTHYIGNEKIDYMFVNGWTASVTLAFIIDNIFNSSRYQIDWGKRIMMDLENTISTDYLNEQTMSNIHTQVDCDLLVKSNVKFQIVKDKRSNSVTRWYIDIPFNKMFLDVERDRLKNLCKKLLSYNGDPNYDINTLFFGDHEEDLYDKKHEQKIIKDNEKSKNSENIFDNMTKEDLSKFQLLISQAIEKEKNKDEQHT